MSKTRDKRIVELELNNKNFEKNAQVSINTIDKLKQALKMDKAEDGFARIEASIKPDIFKPIEDGVEALNKKMGTLGKFSAGILKNIADDAVKYGKQLYNNTIGQITSGGSSRALNIANSKFKLEGLGVAWDEASKDISAAVDGTAYGFDAAATAAAQLSTAGIKLGDSYGGMAHSLKAISGIAAMTNSSYEEIGYIFSQIASAGRLMGQDAMQISTRGINVTQVLAKQLNKTTEEISEMQRKGEISFAMFAEAMNDAFGDQAAKANDTFQGAMSNVKAALSRIGEIWYGPFYNAAIKPLNAIRVAINKIKKAFDDGNDATEDFKSRLTKLMNIVSRIFEFFTESADLRFFEDIAKGLNSVLDFLIDVGEGFEKVLGIFKTDKAVAENEKLGESIDKLTEKELQAAKDIWEKGTYGNGQDRINNLLAAGFSEDEVKRTQAAIDKFIADGYEWSKVEEQIAANGEDVAEATEKFTGNIVKSKILRTLTSARNIVSALKSTFIDVGKAVWNVADILVHSFLETFEFDKIFKDLENLIYKVRNFANSLIGVTKGNKKIKKIFDEIFKIGNSAYRIFKSVASIVGTILYSFIKVIGGVFKEIKLGDSPVSSITDKIADGAEKLADIVKESKIFITIFEKIVYVIKKGITFISEIPTKLKPVFNFIGDGIDNLNNKVQRVTGVDIVGAVEKIINVVKKFFDVMRDPFVIEDNGATAIENWANEVKNALLEPFKKPAEVLETIKKWFEDAFGSIKTEGMSYLTGGIMGLVTSVLEKFFGFIYTINIDELLSKAKGIGAIIALITSIVVGLNINKLIKTIQEPMESIKGLVGKITGFIDTVKGSIEDVSGAIKKDLEADVFIKYAVAIGILAASIAVLGMIDTETLAKGLLSLVVIMAALTGSIVAYNKTVGEGKTQFLNTQIVQLGVVIGLMAGVMIALGNLSYEKLAKGMIAITFIATLFSALTVLSNKMPAKSTWQMGVTIAALGAAILACVPLVKIVGEMRFVDALQGVVALGLVMGGFLGVIFVMNKISTAADPAKAVVFAAAMAIIAASVNLVVPFFLAVGRMDPTAMGLAMVEFAGVLFSVFLVLAGLSKIGAVGSGAVLAATSMAIVFASINLVLPSIVAIATAFTINEDAADKAMRGVLGIITVGGLIMLALGMMTNPASSLGAAAGMAAVFLSLNAVIPAIIALAAIPADKLSSAMTAIIGLTAVFAATIGILAIANDALAEGVVLVMVSLAAIFVSIGYMVSSIIFAVGAAAALIGTGILKISLALDKFSKLDAEGLKENAKQLIKAIEIFATGMIEVAPKIAEAVGAVVGAVSKVMNDYLPKLIDAWFGLILMYIEKLITGVLNIVGIAIYALVEAIVNLVEKIFKKDDEGNSLFTRIMDLMFIGIIDALNTSSKWLGPLAEAVVTWIISLCNAIANAIDEHGDELIESLTNVIDKLLRWLGKAAGSLSEEFEQIGKDILKWMIDGITEKSKKAGEDLSDAVHKYINAFKEHFGIKEGDSAGSVMWKIGSEIVDDFITGIDSMVTAVGEAAGRVASGFVNGFVEMAKQMFPNIEGIGEKMLAVFVHDGLNVNSPPPETVSAGKDMASGPLEGMKSILPGVLDKAKEIGGNILDTFTGAFDSDNSEGGTSLIDSLMNLLGIDMDGDNSFEVTPVLNGDEFDKDYADMISNYGGSSFDTSFGGYSSGLASDVAYSTAGSSGLYSAGSSSADVGALRTSVEDIASRLDKIEVRMDTGALVGALYNGIDEKLGEKQILAGRGVYA